MTGTFDFNSLLGSNKVSLLTTIQNPWPCTRKNKLEYEKETNERSWQTLLVLWIAPAFIPILLTIQIYSTKHRCTIKSCKVVARRKTTCPDLGCTRASHIPPVEVCTGNRLTVTWPMNRKLDTEANELPRLEKEDLLRILGRQQRLLPLTVITESPLWVHAGVVVPTVSHARCWKAAYSDSNRPEFHLELCLCIKRGLWIRF